jgi:hypothetical protein
MTSALAAEGWLSGIRHSFRKLFSNKKAFLRAGLLSPFAVIAEARHEK